MICIISYFLIFMLSYASSDPNIVFILTDDQDLLLSGMAPLTRTVELVGNNGKTFTNAFVNTPVCCPSRSTILTGKFIHNLGVVNNSIAGNCSSLSWQQNHEPHSMAAILKEKKGYVTFYAGKYLNEYGYERAGGIKHIPVGYDWWIGLQGNSRYYNYTLSINGTESFSADDYLTDVLAEHSIKFLENKPQNSPFFMMIATPAAHAPFTPAKRHENSFPNAKVIRTPTFNHSGHDKHWLIRMPPEYLPEDVTVLDKVQQHRQETLLAVDELVEKVVEKLKTLGCLDNTYVIFTSDHGFHIGQFSQPWDKRQPYETDIRVPFLIRGPKIPSNSTETFPISTVDIAPTILDLAGILEQSDMDGVSFKQKLISTSVQPFKESIFIEYWGEGDLNRIDNSCPWKYDSNLTECTTDQWCKCQDSRNNTYTCVVDLSEKEAFKYCEFYDKQHFVEAYNLTADPYELDNVADTIASNKYTDAIKLFKTCKGSDCQSISL